MDTECKLCHRRRADGWLLIDGVCKLCDPLRFRMRRLELREQARKLIEQHPPEPQDAA